ncbi:MAG: asparagine--tRNA ligase [Candidatus Micrarchaeaceae archaeon]
MRPMHISDAEHKIGRPVSITGWVYRKRESGGIIFIIVRDSTGIIQLAIKRSGVDEKSWLDAEKASIESSVSATGLVKKEERSQTGYEIEASSFKNISVAEPFPITEYQSTELLLDKRHLWLRSLRMRDIMKVRAYVFRYAREFLDKRGFYEITPPLITKAGGETGSSMFKVRYFDQDAYLTESSQLYAEAMIFSLEKVYSFAPSYRAEKSRTTKHLAEYWHLEPEMAFYDNKKNMNLQERLVSYIANSLAKKNADLLKTFGVEPEELLKVRPPFKRISYEKAIEILNEKGSKKKWGDDFGIDDERLLTAEEEKPIFIYNWPKEIKAFYMPINPKDSRTVLCADMQAPHGHGEIIGGSERIWRLDELEERMAEVEKSQGIKFNRENYAWWIDLRRYGSVPHAGFGMGIERVIKWLLNLEHIRDAIPFPRMINRLSP